MNKQEAGELLRALADEIPMIGSDRRRVFGALCNPDEDGCTVLHMLVDSIPLKTAGYEQAMEAVRVLGSADEPDHSELTEKPARTRRKQD